MHSSIDDLKNFYNSKSGRVVRRVVQERIKNFWPETKGLSVMGCGYSTPYLCSYKDQSERVVAMMSPQSGVTHWPHDGPNSVALSHGDALPIGTNALDRVLMVHGLEFYRQPAFALDEIWRVLKSDGRALLVVPNRAGLWAHAEWAPFGHGTPYSMSQLCQKLRDAKFVRERSEEALFMPPMRFGAILKAAGAFEHIGANYLPIVAGVHMVEVSKQLYAKATPGGGKASPVQRVRAGLVPKPSARSES